MMPGIFAGAAGAGGGSGGSDPYWANVVALLNMGGADGSTVFNDSTGLRSWTTHGAAEIDTSLGYNAGLFPGGTSDYIDTPEDASTLTMSGDFTIEIGFVANSLSVSGIMCNSASSFGFGDWALILNHATAANKVSFWARDMSPSSLLQSYTISTGALNWIEVGRSGSTLRMHHNGIPVTTVTSSASLQMSRLGMRVGRYWGGAFNGSVVAVRVTKGVCRHPSNTSFTPPSAPFPTS